MRRLASRTGIWENWRDERPLMERADAVGVTPKEPAQGEEDAVMRANRKTVLAKEDAYLNTRPALPPPAGVAADRRARRAARRRGARTLLRADYGGVRHRYMQRI